MPVDLINVKDAAGITQQVRANPATYPVTAGSLPLPDGASTEATLAAVLAKLSGDPATQATLAAILTALGETLAVSGPVTDAELRASPVAVTDVALNADVHGSLTVTQRDNAGEPLDFDAPVGVEVLADGLPVDFTAPVATEVEGVALTALQAIADGIGGAADSAGDPTVIGLLKQIAANTAS